MPTFDLTRVMANAMAQTLLAKGNYEEAVVSVREEYEEEYSIFYEMVLEELARIDSGYDDEEE